MSTAPENEARTTPVGLFHYAHSYAVSAKALIERPLDATHAHAPVRFLISHAVELYLKAFCLAAGVSLSEMRSRSLGHDLQKLLERAADRGLESDAVLRYEVSAMNDAILDRYIETGARSFLTDHHMPDMCAKLHAQVGRVVYEFAGLKRSPPRL